MRGIGNHVLSRWHRMLSLSHQSPPSWYRDRLREELLEHRNAPNALKRLSETSDVLFATIRAQYDGFPVRKLPTSDLGRHGLPIAYMLVKYTMRWGFYRVAALMCRSPYWRGVCEVINPWKDHKLGEVALRHGLDPVKFGKVGRRLRRVWPLLP